MFLPPAWQVLSKGRPIVWNTIPKPSSSLQTQQRPIYYKAACSDNIRIDARKKCVIISTNKCNRSKQRRKPWRITASFTSPNPKIRWWTFLGKLKSRWLNNRFFNKRDRLIRDALKIALFLQFWMACCQRNWFRKSALCIAEKHSRGLLRLPKVVPNGMQMNYFTPLVKMRCASSAVLCEACLRIRKNNYPTLDLRVEGC